MHSHIFIIIISRFTNCNASRRWRADILLPTLYRVSDGFYPNSTVSSFFSRETSLRFSLFINWNIFSARNVPSLIRFVSSEFPSKWFARSFFFLSPSPSPSSLLFFVRNFDGKCKYFYVSLSARSIYILNKEMGIMWRLRRAHTHTHTFRNAFVVQHRQDFIIEKYPLRKMGRMLTMMMRCWIVWNRMEPFIYLFIHFHRVFRAVVSKTSVSMK